MKMQFLICAFGAGLFPLAAQNLWPESGLKNDFPQTVDWSYWDDGWYSDKKVTFTYNSQGLPLSEIWDLAEGTDVKHTYTYAADNLHQTLKLRQEKSGGLWINISRQRREYDVNGKETLMVLENYIGGVWMIESGFQYQPEYLEGMLYQETISSFNPGDGYFHPAFRWTYAWDQNGKPKEQSCENFSEAGAWVNAIRNSYFWNHDNQLDYMLGDIWKANEWIPYSKEMYSYYGVDNHAKALYIWREDLQVYHAWLRLISEYDDRSNLVLSTYEDWHGNGWSVSSGSRYTISYADGHAIERITEKWDAGSPEGATTDGNWTNASREVFSQFFILGIENQEFLPGRLLIFPCPSSDGQINISGYPDSERLEVKVINSSGQTMLNRIVLQPSDRIRINLQDQASGIYILRIIDQDGFVADCKIIKQ